MFDAEQFLKQHRTEQEAVPADSPAEPQNSALDALLSHDIKQPLDETAFDYGLLTTNVRRLADLDAFEVNHAIWLEHESWTPCQAFWLMLGFNPIACQHISDNHIPQSLLALKSVLESKGDSPPTDWIQFSIDSTYPFPMFWQVAPNNIKPVKAFGKALQQRVDDMRKYLEHLEAAAKAQGVDFDRNDLPLTKEQILKELRQRYPSFKRISFDHFKKEWAVFKELLHCANQRATTTTGELFLKSIYTSNQ